LGRDGPHRYAQGHTWPCAAGAAGSEARSQRPGDLYIFRGRTGSLVKVLWHDGLGTSLHAKRLDRGRFVWPSATDGVVAISVSQMACMLEGIDWRNPQATWRPNVVG